MNYSTGLQRADLSFLHRRQKRTKRALAEIPLTLCYGTDAYNDAWACDDASDFARVIQGKGFFPLRALPMTPGGPPEPLRPYAGLEGIKPWGVRQIWISWAY